jgi:hypothetical protein
MQQDRRQLEPVCPSKLSNQLQVIDAQHTHAHCVSSKQRRERRIKFKKKMKNENFVFEVWGGRTDF